MCPVESVTVNMFYGITVYIARPAWPGLAWPSIARITVTDVVIHTN